MPPRVQQATAAQMPRGRFESDTRESLVDLATMTPPNPGTAGQISVQQLPTAGYLSDLYFILTGTTTTTSAQSATVLAYPQPPWNFLRKIRVYTNMGVELVNISGYGLYLYNRVLRGAMDIDTHATADFLTYAVTNGGANATVRSRYLAHPTSLGVSSSETWRAGYWLPITWGTAGKAGYQLLQDDAVKYYFEVTWGDLTNLYASTSGTPTLSNVTVQPIIRTFATPRNPINRPDLSYSKFLLEENQALTAASGTNTFKLVTGNMVTKLIHVLENGETFAPVDPAAVTNFRMDYANTQVPYSLNADLQLLLQEFRYCKPLPQGCYVWDLAMALGLPELPTMRDVIDTIMLTNLESEITVSGLTLAGSNLRTIKELLVPNRNFGG
jgi:hypothetical protein